MASMPGRHLTPTLVHNLPEIGERLINPWASYFDPPSQVTHLLSAPPDAWCPFEICRSISALQGAGSTTFL